MNPTQRITLVLEVNNMQRAVALGVVGQHLSPFLRSLDVNDVPQKFVRGEDGLLEPEEEDAAPSSPAPAKKKKSGPSGKKRGRPSNEERQAEAEKIAAAADVAHGLLFDAGGRLPEEELSMHLQGAGHEPKTISAAIDRLCQEGRAQEEELSGGKRAIQLVQTTVPGSAIAQPNGQKLSTLTGSGSKNALRELPSK